MSYMSNQLSDHSIPPLLGAIDHDASIFGVFHQIQLVADVEVLRNEVGQILGIALVAVVVGVIFRVWFQHQIGLLEDAGHVVGLVH